MDIQSAGDKLLNLTLQNLQKTKNEQLVLIARLTGMTVNNSSKALVVDVANSSPEDREILVAQIDKALAQIKTNSLLPAVQQQIEALEQQKNLLQSNLLKLITLEVNNKSFLVYSNQSLVKGQQISLGLIPNVGLALLSNPDEIPESIKIEQTITQNLRQLLPLISHLPSQKQDNFYTALAQLIQVLTKIPEKQLDQLIDKPLKTSLDKLIDAIPNLAKVIDPKILKVIIDNSGIQFEKRLVASLNQPQLPTTNNTTGQIPADINELIKNSRISSETTMIKSPADKIPSGQSLTPQNLAPLLNAYPTEKIASITHPVTNTTTNISSTYSSNFLNTSKISPSVKINVDNINQLQNSTKPEQQGSQKTQDMKGALVDLVAKTTQSLTEEEADIATIIKNLNNTHLKDWVTQLLPMLMGKTPHKELSIKTLRTQLIALLQQHAYQAVAKIQIQQLQSLQPQTTPSTDYPQQSWQIEIPIRYQHDIHPLQMQIERYWIEDKEKSTEQKREKVKQWRIMLNFDLPIVGHFYAQLIWFNQQLSATLWAEKIDTLKLAKEKMENLRTKLQQEGITVTQLDCLPGAPNKPQNEIQYSLIDVKT
jgi:hypothetical protein